MKQNIEEPDYRSMNEVQLKYELIKLEKKILDITGDPIDYKHYSPFLDWCRDDAKVEAVEEMMLDRCFILNLLFDIHCTPAEVARLEKINGMLMEMTNRTYHRTADMIRALMVMKKDNMDDDFELEGKLAPRFDIPSSGKGRLSLPTRISPASRCSSTAGPPGRSGQGSSPRQTFPTECQRGRKKRGKAKTGMLLSRYFYVNLQYGYK